MRTIPHSSWIIWNLFLAFIPLVLSFWLFRSGEKPRSFLWWSIFGLFLAFLPNAPYVLTDIIHLIDAIRTEVSVWFIVLVIIPLHLAAIFAGLESYVISLLNVGFYLQKQGLKAYILITELGLHFLCSIGIYLGRFHRFNSWDILSQPDDLLLQIFEYLPQRNAIGIIVLTFCILTIVYWVAKQISLGIGLRIKNFLES
jgi:uncharacterized membrane protein